MFITENQSIAESILFLLSAREALSHIVEASSVAYKTELKSFLMNEASDYEIIHMLMHEEMPDVKYNFSNEVRLFSDLKEQVLINFDKIKKYLGEDVVTFINEVDTVYPNFSSAAPILEFRLTTKDHALNEVFDKEGVGIEKVVDYMKHGNAPADLAKVANKVSSILGKAGRAAVAAGNKKLALLKLTNKGVDPSTANKMFSMQQKAVTTVGKANYVGKGIDAGTANKMFSIAKSTKNAGATAKAAEKIGLRGGSVPQAATASTAGAGAKALALIKMKATSASAALSQAAVTPAGMAVGGAALAALAIYVSIKVYKRFMSKAAKSCGGKSGRDKTLCMIKFQHDAIGAQIKDLGSAINACAKSKAPEKCKIPIQKKISKLQVKMQKMKAKMAG